MSDKNYNNKNSLPTVVFTDAKLDDLLALAILARKCHFHPPLHVVLVNIHDTQGAAVLVRRVVHESNPICALSISRGKVVRGADDLPNHEALGMYEGLAGGGEQLPQFDQANLVGCAVFIIAPCEEYTDQIVQVAKRVYAGMGYNTRGVSIQQFKAMEDKLHVMNNFGSYAKGAEGGNVTRDNMWWDPIVKAVPSLQRARENAFLDTSYFMARQLVQIGMKFGVVVDEEAILKEPFSETSKNLAREVVQAAGDHTYATRILKMIESGEILNEVTDAQQVAMWLECGDQQVSCTVVEDKDKGFITFKADPEGEAKAFFQLNVDFVNSIVRHIFES